MGVLGFEIRDDGSRGGFDRPEPLMEIENGDPPIGAEVTVEFFKDCVHVPGG